MLQVQHSKLFKKQSTYKQIQVLKMGRGVLPFYTGFPVPPSCLAPVPTLVVAKGTAWWGLAVLGFCHHLRTIFFPGDQAEGRTTFSSNWTEYGLQNTRWQGTSVSTYTCHGPCHGPSPFPNRSSQVSVSIRN